MAERSYWPATLAAIIALGVASRSIHTGLVVFDKYLGDALYAALFFVIFRIAAPLDRPRSISVRTLAVMLLIELFQLTLIPASMVASESTAVRLLGRLLGTEFSWFDLAAYAVGIATLLGLDLVVLQRRSIGNPKP